MLAAEELAEKSAPEATTIWRYTLEEFGQVDQLKEFSNYVSQRLDRKPADIPEGKQSESQPYTDPVVDEEVAESAP